MPGQWTADINVDVFMIITNAVNDHETQKPTSEPSCRGENQPLSLVEKSSQPPMCLVVIKVTDNRRRTNEVVTVRNDYEGTAVNWI